MAKKKAGGGSVKSIGRWVPIGMKPASAQWKSVNAADEHVIFLLDSATGEISICGDTSGVRSGLGVAEGAAATLVTPPRSKRKRAAKTAPTT